MDQNYVLNRMKSWRDSEPEANNAFMDTFM